MLLKKCKDRVGPITILKELNLFLKSTHKEDKKKFLRQEIQFPKITHKKDSIKRPELHRLNGLTLPDFSVNLAAILTPDSIIDKDETLLFESADEIMEIIVHDHTEEKQAAFSAQDPLAVVWDNNDHARE